MKEVCSVSSRQERQCVVHTSSMAVVGSSWCR